MIQHFSLKERNAMDTTRRHKMFICNGSIVSLEHEIRDAMAAITVHVLSEMLTQKHFRDFRRHMAMIRCIRVRPVTYNMFLPQTLRILKSDILTAVIMTCNPLEIYQSFGGACRHLKGRRISQTRNQHKEGKRQGSLSTCLFLSFDHEEGGDMFFRNVGCF
jgi:hypothetical protein